MFISELKMKQIQVKKKYVALTKSTVLLVIRLFGPFHLYVSVLSYAEVEQDEVCVVWLFVIRSVIPRGGSQMHGLLQRDAAVRQATLSNCADANTVEKNGKNEAAP